MNQKEDQIQIFRRLQQ